MDKYRMNRLWKDVKISLPGMLHERGIREMSEEDFSQIMFI